MTKHSDLKYPHVWEERAVHFENNLLFVPDFYHQHAAVWGSLDEVFGNDHPVHLEYCSGNGAWILEKAIAHPNLNWIAVEKRFDRVRKLYAKRENRSVKNLMIVKGKAEAFTDYYLQDKSIEQIYINFPDPWPKDRHAKHRLVTPEFARGMARVVKDGGRALLVTDDLPCGQNMLHPMLDSKCWNPLFEDPYFVINRQDYGSSYFSKLWIQKGKAIHYYEFEKQ